MGISIHFSGKNNFDLLYIIPITRKSELKYINSFIKKQAKENELSISSRTYNNTKVFDIKNEKQEIYKSHLVSYSFSNSFFLISRSPILVENSIRQLNSNISLKENSDFKQISSTAGKNVQANIYIRYKNFSRLLQSVAAQKELKNVGFFNNFAAWTELDLNLKKDALIFSGYTLSKDSNNHFLSILKNQTAQTIRVTEIVPASSSILLLYSFSDYRTLYTNYKHYIGLKGNRTKHK